ncbi:MAG: insulinase family protein [Candidatus Aminicenantes bacterium]|nr:insulinase family protein [Candidatus Aminicenantes bacterium]
MLGKGTRTVLAVLLAAAALQAAFRKEDVRVHTLDNGLKVLLLEDRDIPNVALYTFFRVGSRNERPGTTGLSHFLEHMMFNGTARFGPGEFDRVMEFRGGANNAWTSEDMTVYTDWFPASALEAMLDLEADRMQGLAFDPEVFESERGVVASERRMAVENNNEGLLAESVQATAVMAHPYHWSVIGWMSDILSWSLDDISLYYRTFYAPNNAVLVLVGDFDAASAMDLIKKHYGSIPSSPPPPPVTTVEPEQLGPRLTVIRKEAQAPSFLMAYHAPACSGEDYPALAALEKALLDGESSRLYRRLVREEKLALAVGGGMQETIDPFLFTIAVKPRPGADLDRLEAVIEEELARLSAVGLTEREFKKALNIIRSDFYAGLQTIAGQATLLGLAELLYGSYEHAFTIMNRYDALSLDKIGEAAARTFAPEKKTVGKLIPQGGTR